MDWKNWAGGQRTWRCAATRDTWLITWLVTRVTWLIICLAVLCQHWWAVRAKSKLEMQSFFSHFPTNTKAIKMLITHNGMIPLSTAPLISADFCIQTQFVCQARDQKSQSQSWRKSNCLLFARKLEIKSRANVSWSCGQIQNMLSLARSKGNDGFDMNYEFPGRSKQNIKIN